MHGLSLFILLLTCYITLNKTLFMKRLTLLFALFIVLTFISCRKENTQSATVIKDCTGTYLRMSKKDFFVCNVSITESYKSEAQVLVSFKNVQECNPDENEIVCYMLHENEGPIEISKIKSE